MYYVCPGSLHGLLGTHLGLRASASPIADSMYVSFHSPKRAMYHTKAQKIVASVGRAEFADTAIDAKNRSERRTSTIDT